MNMKQSTSDTLRRMRAAYGEFIDRHPPLDLDASNVPLSLVDYIPYAALWGIADDVEREQRIAKAPDVAKADLVSVVQSIDHQLNEWLAGAEATSPRPTREYIAFSAMRMAADFI